MAVTIPCYLLLSFLVWPIRSYSSSHILSRGSSLNVQNKEDVLISSDEVFSAGFYSVGVNAYCFAIWFTEPLSDGNLTVVWMANRDDPVNGKGSKLSLSRNGNLVLKDAARLHASVWEISTNSTANLSLEDYGNLVLVTPQGDILWQSFDSPTDTLLPHQVLTREAVLISSKSSTLYSSGFYKFHFDEYNLLRLSFNNLEVSSLYWPYAWEHPADENRTMYNSSRIAVLDTYGSFMSSDNLHFTTSDFGLQIRRRMIVEPDGNIRVYSLNVKRKVWEVTWQAISRPCRIHGVCGGNSLCTYTQFGRECTCIPGHKLKVQTDWSYGCEPDFKASDHGSNSFGFLQLSHSDFYGYDSGLFINFTFDRCKQECLSHYNCKGFLYTAQNYKGSNLCYTKSRLLNGQQTADFQSNIYVKLPLEVVKLYNKRVNSVERIQVNCSAQNILHLDKSYKKSNRNYSVIYMLWFICALGGLELILIAFFLSVSLSARRTTQVYHQVGIGFKRFKYDELKKGTHNFSLEIGRGGNSIVYKGVLLDNRVAAIKRFKEANYNGEAEFLAEISILGMLNHMNLIETWGYCIKGKQRFLVSEYLDNGSLADNLSSCTLDWQKMYEIALGTAKGLAYLHEECLEWVLHCDVKPQNILLDSNYNPKVADFGLSKLLKRDVFDNSSISKIRGTRGYMAPEWAVNHRITSKVDVYSYGVLVLQMITGKSPTMAVSDYSDDGSGSGSGRSKQKDLLKWISGEMENGSTIEYIADSRITGIYDLPRMETLVQVALQCVREDPNARPTMSQVVEMIDGNEI